MSNFTLTLPLIARLQDLHASFASPFILFFFINLLIYLYICFYINLLSSNFLLSTKEFLPLSWLRRNLFRETIFWEEKVYSEHFYFTFLSERPQLRWRNFLALLSCLACVLHFHFSLSNNRKIILLRARSKCRNI